jgi:branched-chain amino acid transport system permease protein
MDVFFSQLANGLSTGALYALLALSLVFIFRSTDIVNFAQGEMATFGAYIGWSLSIPLAFGWVPIVSADKHVNLGNWSPTIFGQDFSMGTANGEVTRLGYIIIFIAAIAISFIIGALIERFVIRPSEGKNVLNAVIVTLGLFVLFNSLSLYYYGPTPKVYPSPVNAGRAVDLGLFRISEQAIFSFLVAVVLMIAVYYFFQHTKLGLGVRAAALNPLASQLMGINTGHMLTLGWGLAAAIGCVAAMMVAPQLSGISPSLMLTILLYAFAAAVLGGLDSVLGAVLGGLAVGVGQAMVVQYIGSQYSDLVAFALIIAVLMVKPTGLFGSPVVNKV